MSKQSNLLSFFGKGKAVPLGEKKSIESPKTSSSKSLLSKKKQNSKQFFVDGHELKPLDLVWAKLDTYPWWPALIYEHPIEKKFRRRKQIHVQFFENPPSRAWIKESFVKPYQFQSVYGIPCHEDDPLWVDCKSQADDAVKLSKEERADIIVELVPTDDELDSTMEDLNDSDKSKENVDINNKRRKSDVDGDEPKVKKRRIVLVSDESASEDEYKPTAKDFREDDSSASSGVDENEVSDFGSDSEMEITPLKNVIKGKATASSKVQLPRRPVFNSNVLSEPETEEELSPVKQTPSSKVSNGNSSVNYTPIQKKTPASSDNSFLGTPKVSSATPNNSFLDTPKVSRATPNNSLLDTPKVSSATPNNSFLGTPKVSSATPNNSFLGTPKVSSTTKSKLSLFAAKETPQKAAATESSEDWPYTRVEYLKPEKIRDKNQRTPDDELYDPRTLYVPEHFLNKQTPAMRQWWVLKAQHFDSVLFFKMGKFYELFHMDAVLSVKELGLLMMKGENAHTGFPEISYGRYSALLIERGYKVARVEQTETPDMMEKRCKKASKTTKYDKVVNREICQITSLGTRVPSVMDGNMIQETSTTYLIALTERVIEGAGDMRKIGICFINTTIGNFHIGQFEDDRHLSRLRTLLAHYPPAQILYEKSQIQPKTLKLIKTLVPAGLLDYLHTEKEFWTPTKTFSYLMASDYLKVDDNIKWPETLQNMMEGESLGMTATSDHELGICALGAIIWYLSICYLEQDLLTRRMFAQYIPPDSQEEVNATKLSSNQFLNKHMIMDGTTLRNLEIFENSSNKGAEGTLFQTLNHCQTSFGKRLLHNWICSPLCNQEAIDNRLNAIEDLRELNDITARLKPLMSQLPDLEKLIAKIHSQSLKRKQDHPDSRAIFFEAQKFSQRKVQDFLSTINGFKSTMTIIDWFKDAKSDLKSKLLNSCVTLQEDGGNFPQLKQVLQFFDGAFDHDLAKKEGKIIPSQGVDEDYDRAIDLLNETKKESQRYLKEQADYFGVKVIYFGSEKKRYQLEMSDNAAKRADDSYELISQRKGFKRFWTEETKDMLSRTLSAEEDRQIALTDIARRIFEQFDQHIKEWNQALECISVLDVLLSLSDYSLQVESVRPTVITPSDNTKPFVNIREGRHPCAIKIFSGGDYIPNDVVIGCDAQHEDSNQALVLVTGPNMGGKSTLMRQTALICLMAQLGSYVPATECQLTAVDRIFTRLGAWDQIFQGESTFYVEMAETASIVQHATHHSLVIVDELGRGTATYDGTAIAFAVVDALTKIRCRTLFSTHYHSLVDDFKQTAGVSLGHMACMVENENDEDATQEKITFLYKFVTGSCPKSYGFNAARLASLPESVIQCARKKARELEISNEKKTHFRLLFGGKNREDLSVRQILSKLKSQKSL